MYFCEILCPNARTRFLTHSYIFWGILESSVKMEEKRTRTFTHLLLRVLSNSWSMAVGGWWDISLQDLTCVCVCVCVCVLEKDER